MRHKLKLCLSVVLKQEIHRTFFFLDTKVTLSKTITEILRKFVFLTIFEKGQILMKIWICLKNIFVFLHKVSHKLLNYVSIFGGIHRKIFFLDTKVTLSKMITEILRKFVFLTIFEKGQILMKIWICLKNSFDQTS